MLRKFDSFIPPFLRQLDHQLLTNRPGLWATKIHYILYFFTIGAGLLFLQGFTRNISLQDVPSPDINTMLLVIPATIAFLFWAYRVSLFQVERTFGIPGKGKIRDQFIYAAVILALGFTPVIYGHLLNHKIKQQISEEQLISDINTLNIGENLFITDPYIFENTGAQKGFSEEIINIGYNRYSHYSYYPVSLLRETEINNILNQTLSEPEMLRIISNFIEVFNKYTREKIDLSPEEILARYQQKKFDDFRQNRFETAKYEVTTNLERLQRAWGGKFEISNHNFGHFYLFALVIIWMAFQVFLSTSWKIFAGSAITGIISIILISISFNTIRYLFNVYDDSLIGMIVIVAFTFFTYQAFRRKQTERMIAWKSVALSVITMTTLIMPFIITSSFSHSMNDETAILLFYTGSVMGIILWNSSYKPRFSKLAAFPREN
ncbi:MAG: hypothetical protein R3D00_03035 [Bacteroidia bacterium]